MIYAPYGAACTAPAARGNIVSRLAVSQIAGIFIKHGGTEFFANVTPAKAGVWLFKKMPDARLRGHDNFLFNSSVFSVPPCFIIFFTTNKLLRRHNSVNSFFYYEQTKGM